MQLVIGALGAAIGAFIGLLVASIYNLNCDSVAEELAGCTRFEVSYFVKAGALIGVGLGLAFGGALAARGRRRDV